MVRTPRTGPSSRLVRVSVEEVVGFRGKQAIDLSRPVAMGERDPPSGDLDLPAGMMERETEPPRRGGEFRRIVHVAGDEIDREQIAKVVGDEKLLEQIGILEVAKMQQTIGAGGPQLRHRTRGALSPTVAVRQHADSDAHRGCLFSTAEAARRRFCRRRNSAMLQRKAGSRRGPRTGVQREWKDSNLQPPAS